MTEISKELERLRRELTSLASVRLGAHFSVDQARRYRTLCHRELELMGQATPAAVPGAGAEARLTHAARPGSQKA